MRLHTLLFTLLAALLAIPAVTTAAISCAPATPQATPGATASTAAYPSFPENGGELRIMAAASLTDAFAEMESLLEERYPALEITIETAGSQTLVTQLQQGAEADILATADTVTMQAAAESDLLDSAPIPFAANRLVIAVPDGNPAGIASIDDLAGDDISLVLAGADVPAGAYARTALCAHAETTADADAWLEDIEANIASEEPDVRHVLTKLILGEADAGIVYASDATAAERAGTPLQVIDLPDDGAPRATYPIAPLAGGNTDLANAFIGFVLSDDGQEILANYGFAR